VKEDFSALREGRVNYLLPLVIGVAVLAWAVPADRPGFALIGLLFLLGGIYSVFFFRDPKRKVPSEPGLVVSAADGTIVGVEDFTETPYFSGPCKRVSIFLSIFNVHVNRAPAAGTVREIQYRPGRFLDARLPETSDANEAMNVYLDTEHGPMTVRQISGLVARRIVCRCRIGDRLERGEKFGMIKFGSRTEIYLPPNAEILVKVGDKVKAGEDAISRFT
jgi:phosphatidylserine decarboxylase